MSQRDAGPRSATNVYAGHKLAIWHTDLVVSTSAVGDSGMLNPLKRKPALNNVTHIS